MKWVKCSNCGHKLFMVQGEGKESDNLHINIKCSSCKRILDVVVLNGKVEVKENEKN